MFSCAMCLPSLLREGPLRAASRALIVYLDFFLAQIHLDGLLILDDPLADTDLLFEHDLLGDNDFLLEDLHNHLVLADIRLGSCAGLPGLVLYRHPLDDYLLAPLRDPHHLALCSHALFDVHLTSLTLADACAEFLLRALHSQVFVETAALATALVGDRPHGAVRRLFIAFLVSQNGPFWAGNLYSEQTKVKGTRRTSGRVPKGSDVPSGR